MADPSVEELLRLLDEDRRRASRSPGEMIHWDRDESCEQVLYAEINAGNADEVIEGAVRQALDSGKDLEWKLYSHDTPRDLPARLASAGLVPGETETVLVLPLEPLPPWAEHMEIEVREVTSLEMVEVYRTLAESVFDKDYSYTAGELLASLRSGRRDHLGFIAYDGEAPVGMARLYPWTENHFGGLYGGGVLRSHRGRGFYRGLLAARVRRARQLGVRRLVIDALPTSRPIVENLGFIPITQTTPFTLAK